MPDSIEKQIEALLTAMPGKRGIDIPEQHYDTIQAHASAITLPVWGRHPTPEHMAGFYAVGAHENPQLIQDYYHNQPHPHAEGMTVGEYPAWEQAHKTWKEHTRG